MQSFPTSRILKELLPPFLIMIAVISVFFYPQLQGKKIEAGDAISSTAWSSEIAEFKAETGKRYNWNGAIFSGMPWGLLGVGTNKNLVRWTGKLFKLGMKGPLGISLKAGILTFIALLILGTNPWICMMASLVFALNLNGIILLEAGHQSKLAVIATFPLVLGGFIACHREQFIRGAICIGIGSSLAILNNHIQMVYYLILCLVISSFIYLIFAGRSKSINTLLKASIIALGAALVGGASNFAQLYSSNNFKDDTMRGKPILEIPAGTEISSSSQVEGLDWNYAMSWSNNFIDVLSIFVPRAAGGASGERISTSTRLGNVLQANGVRADRRGNVQSSLYWGALPFTSGPYYIGAALLTIFIFSLFVVSARIRYASLASILLIVLISCGKNVEWLNKFFFDNLPLFNSFRTPNSIITLLPLFVTIVSGIGLHQIISQKKKSAYLRPLSIALGISGGIYILLGILVPGSFDFLASTESNMQDQIKEIYVQTRKDLLRQDVIRAFCFTALTGIVLYLFIKNKFRSSLAVVACLTFIILLDMWPVNRRYLNIDNYASPREYGERFAARPADEQIFQLETNGRGYYRVLDLSINTFSSAQTSFHHNTIGGYHPAKLQRYDDIIQRLLMRGHQASLNMLNAKYIIERDGRLRINSNALGSAWFVENIEAVETPNQEIDALQSLDPSTTAVMLESEFSDIMAEPFLGDGRGSIDLIDYEPNKLTYEYSTNTDQLAVFSEVWYGPNKGWHVSINGEPANMLRANYILRALQVPSGTGQIVFEFRPKVVGASISLMASIAILAASIFFLVMFLRDSTKLEKWLVQLRPAPIAENTAIKTPTKARVTQSSKKKAKKKKKGNR